ncbi:hypothetical protein HQ560_01360 [bacterium]|nr:hypothetical protein [bacterium]
MSHDNCTPIRDGFLDLTDGRLGAEPTRRLREEIASCAACGQAWERWKQDDLALASALRAEVAPRDIAGPVLAVVRRGRPAARLPRRVLVRLAAAAVVLLAVGGVYLATRKRHDHVGRVETTRGHPTMLQPGAKHASIASEAATVLDGAIWKTGSGDEVRIQLDDGSILVVKPGAEVRLHGKASQCALADHLPHICLRRGEVELELASTALYRAVGTPLGTVMTDKAHFTVSYEPNARTTVRAISGQVVFSCPARQVNVMPGSAWTVEAASGVPRLVPDGK